VQFNKTASSGATGEIASVNPPRICIHPQRHCTRAGAGFWYNLRLENGVV